ncbi:DUF6020 family protein [Qiania dongpingensis]|uniref:Glycosyltransferase RgtA/B/C/D-like domain-containing protein n=1 Tax=Qiania dongpingensis TaxID=2763669 RepID=A0A7G9G7T7_9FIRM|nr:DUF6020 family protein [Qiania dongpingensis]QNM06869.1 hypothetical protein H9Q78_07100 [Qiania dongpingensis]
MATYPGIYSYDAYPQVLQILGGEGLSAHHPLIHTFLLNGCLYAGHWLTGDYNTGMLIYTVVQIFFMASVFSYALDRMKVYKISLFIRVLSYLFLAFSPINQIWVCLTTKDTIFGGLLLLVFLDIVDMVLDSEVFYSSKYRLARFIVLGIFMCLFRNQGIYLIFLAAPFLIWALKGYRKKCALVLFAVVLSTKIFTGPISSWMGAKPANPREALSVPIQQIARVLVQEPDSVTDEEKEIIYRYLPEEYISQYNASVSDAVKEGFNAKYFKENPMPFFKVWASVGLRNFSAYVDSFLYGSCGYFYTDYSPYWVQFILYDGSWTSEEFNFLKIERNTLFPAYDNYLRKVSTELIQEKIPVVSVILNEAFPFLTLIFVGGYLFYIKRYKLLLPLLVIFGFWGTNLLGPVIVMRYAFPIVICVPSMVSLIFIQQKDKRLLLSKEKGKERL